MILALLLATASIEEGPTSLKVDWLGPKGANGPNEEVDDVDDYDNHFIDTYMPTMAMGRHEIRRVDA